MRLVDLATRSLFISLTYVAVSACGSPATPPQASLPVARAGAIEISEPRIRLPAAGQTQTAAYLTLSNKGTQSDRLVSAVSPQAKQLELHAHTKTADGMMRMRQLDFIELPSGATIALVPGGLHIMVKQVNPGIKIGDRVDVDLKFASGLSASLKLPVVANPRAHTEGEEASKHSHQH